MFAGGCPAVFFNAAALLAAYDYGMITKTACGSLIAAYHVSQKMASITSRARTAGEQELAATVKANGRRTRPYRYVEHGRQWHTHEQRDALFKKKTDEHEARKTKRERRSAAKTKAAAAAVAVEAKELAAIAVAVKRHRAYAYRQMRRQRLGSEATLIDVPETISAVADDNIDNYMGDDIQGGGLGDLDGIGGELNTGGINGDVSASDAISMISAGHRSSV
jgi:hypothetical protein